MNDEGLVLTSFRPTTEARLTGALEDAQEAQGKYRQLKEAAAKSSAGPEVRFEFLQKRLDMEVDETHVARLKALIDSGQLDAGTLKKARSIYTAKSYKLISNDIDRAGGEAGTRDKWLELARPHFVKLHKMHKAGDVIERGDRLTGDYVNFWIYAGLGALAENDDAAFEACVERLEKAAEENRRMEGAVKFLKSQKK